MKMWKKIYEEKDPEKKMSIYSELMDEEFMVKFRPRPLEELEKPNLESMFKCISKQWEDPEKARIKAELKRR